MKDIHINIQKNNELYLIIFLACCYLFISSVNIPLIEDYGGLSLVNPSDYFILIINVVSMLTGFIVAMSIFTIGITNKNMSYRIERAKKQVGLIVDFLKIAISLIIITTISYVRIQDFADGRDITVGYFSGFLFISFLVYIVFKIKQILVSSDLFKIINDNIGEIVENQDRHLNSGNINNGGLNSNLSKIHYDILFFMNRSDFSAVNICMNQMNDGVKYLLNECDKRAKDHKDYILQRNEYDEILKLSTQAWNVPLTLPQINGYVLYHKMIWDCISDLYTDCAAKGGPIAFYSSIRNFIEGYIKRLF